MKLSNKYNILVTGANGFIGNALCNRLAKNENYSVVQFDIDDGDIADYDFSNCNAKHVCHLAARTFVPQSWEQPYEYYKTNLLGTINVLDYCRKNNASMTFVSAYMYGSPQYLPIDENHPLEAHSVYNHTKLLSEEACAYYSKHFNVSVSILRLFNVYGKGQGQDFLIPSIIKQAMNNDKIEVMDTTPKRDFIYIDDVIDAIYLTIELEGFHIYNIGSGLSFSVLDVINNICSAIGDKKQIIDKKQVRPNEVFDVVADISKIKSELNWEPKTSFEEGIKKTVSAFNKGIN